MGTTWGKKLYKLLWTLLKSTWIARNEHLHETDRIYELQGLPQLQEAIKKEYALGLHRLPACEFSIYFSSRLDKLLQSKLDTLKTWLYTIRLGRELHGGIDRIDDEFTIDGPLRSWLGLPKINTN